MVPHAPLVPQELSLKDELGSIVFLEMHEKRAAITGKLEDRDG